MQAGESLSFMAEMAVHGDLEPREEYEVRARLMNLVASTLHTHEKFVDRVHEYEDDREVIVEECSLKTELPDGSYIHIVVYGHSIESGYIDLNVALCEHDDNGRFVKGNVFVIDDEVVDCSEISQREDLPGSSENDQHFSIVKMYRSRYEVYESLFSDDPYIRHEAEQIWNKISLDNDFELMTRQFTRYMPTLDQIVGMQALLIDAKPFQH